MNPRLLIAIVLGCGALFVTVLAVAATREEAVPADGERRFQGSVLPDGLRAPAFELSDQDGERVSMRALRGEPVIVTFLYTTCEETCPSQAQQVRAALDELGEDVPALAVAVDPPRDTAASARAFLADQRLTGRMDFVLGSREELQRVWRGFAVEPQREALEHTARLVLVGPDGWQRVGYPFGEVTGERVAHDVRLLQSGA